MQITQLVGSNRGWPSFMLRLYDVHGRNLVAGWRNVIWPAAPATLVPAWGVEGWTVISALLESWWVRCECAALLYKKNYTNFFVLFWSSLWQQRRTLKVSTSSYTTSGRRGLIVLYHIALHMYTITNNIYTIVFSANLRILLFANCLCF